MASRGSTSRIKHGERLRIFGRGGAPRIGQHRGDLLEQPLALRRRKFAESLDMSSVGDGLRKDAEEVAVARNPLVCGHGLSLVLRVRHGTPPDKGRRQNTPASADDDRRFAWCWAPKAWSAPATHRVAHDGCSTCRDRPDRRPNCEPDLEDRHRGLGRHARRRLSETAPTQSDGDGCGEVGELEHLALAERCVGLDNDLTGAEHAQGSRSRGKTVAEAASPASIRSSGRADGAEAIASTNA